MNTQTRFFSLAALLLAAAGFSACSSDSNTVIDQPEVTPAPKTYSVSIDAAKGEDGSISRALSLDGDNNLTSAWAQGEEVTVYNNTQKAALTGTLTAQAAGANTTLAGTLTGNIEAGDQLLLKFCSDSYNSQNGTLEYISANCDYATATVTVDNVTESAFVVNSTAEFKNQQAIIKFTLKDKGNSDALINPTAFTITDGTSTVTLSDIPDATYTTNGNGVLFVAFPAAGEAKTITLTATVGSKTYTYEKADITFTNSEFWTIPVKMELPVNPLESVTTADIGRVIGDNGKIYDTVKAAEEDNTTAIAMIAYVGPNNGKYHGGSSDVNSGSNYYWQTLASSPTEWSSTFNHGLAISLKDLGAGGTSWATKLMTWAEAGTGIIAAQSNSLKPSTATAGTTSNWFLPSLAQWLHMMEGCGGGTFSTAVSSGKSYSYGNFQTLLNDCGATKLRSGYYWCSTRYGVSDIWVYTFTTGRMYWYTRDDDCYVRAALAF